MNPSRSSPLLRLGLIIHGNKIWFCKFLSIVLISSILVAFFALTFLIVIDEWVIRSNDRSILALASSKIEKEKEEATLASRARTINAIRVALGDKLPPQTCSQLADLVNRNSSTYGYDPLLLLAVINVESRFSTKAEGQYRSGAASGAFGLMQLKLETAQIIAGSLGMAVHNTSDLFKPDVNVALGVAYLTRLIAQFRSFKLGLLAYNQGPGVILEQLASQQPLSIEYYNRVLRAYYQFKAITDSLGIPAEK